MKMQLEGMMKRLKDAGRNIFLGSNDAASIKKRHMEPHVFVKINGKNVRITDITTSECNIYLETEDPV
jgi:hypothetical protein